MTRHVLLGLLILTGSILHASLGYTHWDRSGHALGTDDAYISYRYARNFAEGHGLVFNPGERVEGYSNFLYVLLMAPAFWLTEGAGVYAYSFFWNAIALALSLVWFQRHLERSAGKSAARAGGLALALHPVFWSWAASGLETPFVLFLQIAIWTSVEEAQASAGTRGSAVLLSSSVALALVRADGFVFPALAALFLVWQGQRRVALRCALAVAATALATVAGRLWYYGSPLPNTYYVKVTGPLLVRLEHASRQLWSDSLSNGMMPYLVVLLAFALLLARWRGREQVRAELFLGGGVLFYWLYVGGDVFGERFLLVLPPLALSLLLRWAPAYSGAIAAVLVLVQATVFLTDQRFAYSTRRYDRWVTLGRFLEVRHKGELIAVDAAGKIPFFSRLETIDMLGLNDPVIARAPGVDFWLSGHNKFDADYVLSRGPELICGGVFEDLDMDWGLERELYQGRGYALRYLLNTGPASSTLRPSPSDDIVDVRGMSEAEVSAWIRSGHRYGVLEQSRSQNR